MQIYNTLSGKKEEFVPIKKDKVSIYVCGLTVYDYFHIGNSRPFIVFDSFRRYLELKGYKVDLVINITDVDDRIINKAEEENVTPEEIASRYTKAYFDDVKKLKVKDATFNPKATEHIDEMIDLVEKLIENGYAYKINGDVYFSVEKFSEYGRLSGKKIEELLSGARIEVDERKKDPLDFALWKANKGESIYWESPWGKGRPGWHLECSAMSTKYLGKEFDIHAGGEDLIFPHHENEIAQSRCGYGGNFARYWMHNGFLKIRDTKMSKSLGNYFTAREILDEFSPESIRLFYFQKHYRNPVDYEPALLQDSEKAVEKLNRTFANMKNMLKSLDFDSDDKFEFSELDAIKNEITKALDDDFDTPVAIGRIFDLNKIANSLIESGEAETNLLKIRDIVKYYEEIDTVFGIFQEMKSESFNEDKLIDLLISIRTNLRKQKLWEMSDKIRDKLLKLGIIIEDTKDGIRWRRE